MRSGLIGSVDIRAGKYGDRPVGTVECCSAIAIPGRARPAAQPQTELTTTIAVPGALIAASTSWGVRVSFTPIWVNSSRMGLIRISGYGIPLSYHRRWLKFFPEPDSQQEREQYGIDQRFLNVALDPPPVVNDPQNSSDIHQSVQCLPTLSTQPGDPLFCGGDCERDHQHKCGKSHRDELSLNDIFDDEVDIEDHRKPDIGKKVQKAVENANSPSIRLNRTAKFQPKSSRSGVMASVISTKRRVQSPVLSVITLRGSAPSELGSYLTL
jgi:hypothetical protein